MKKHFLLSLLLLCTVLTLSAAAAGTVYVADGGNGDGRTAASPLGDLAAAYNALGEDGGTIVIVETYTLSAAFVEPAHSGEITLTQQADGKSYRTEAGSGVYFNSMRYILNGPTTFTEITFRGKGADIKKNNGALLVAQFHPVKMGAGVECLDFGAYTDIASSFSIIGGAQAGADKWNTLTDDLDSHITVESGEFSITAFSRQIDKLYTGMAHIELAGGTFHRIYLGAINKGRGGDTDVTVTGGTFVGDFTAGTSGKVAGNITITLKGGDFTGLKSTDGGCGGKSRIDMTALSAEAAGALKTKLAGFDEIVTEAGTTSSKIPDEVFLSGRFTASDGTTIPYRYYLPEGYATSGRTYPVFLYLHGNGSRGSDNKTQLTTNGAALNTAVLNSDYACIMIAPQCPAHPAEWIDRNAYPGSDAFAADIADGKLETRIYLNAAAELLNSFLTNADYHADTSRIYVTGSSNGGGATWALAALYPDVFAAAIPMCGTGNSLSPVTKAGANALVKSYLDMPIWTFHGDADTTLSIEGTRGIVDAVKAAGGTKINFTVIPNGSHNIVGEAAGTAGLVDWIFAQANDRFKNTLPGAKPDAGDLDGDGRLTLRDVLTMAKRIADGDKTLSQSDIASLLARIAADK